MLRIAAFSLTAAGALAAKIHEATEGPAIPEIPKVPVPEIPEFFPVPTSSRCVVITVCQYMLVFLALAVCRSYHDFTGKPQGAVMAGLKAAAQTVTYGPMICVLFIACRMNVEFLSAGTEQPQMWVQNCMYGVTFAVLASTLVVLLMPLVTGKGVALKPGTSDLEAPSADEDNMTMFYVMSGLRYAIMLGLYGGVAGVIAGIFLYMPAGVTDRSSLPQPAPAVLSTIIISCMFFATQLVIAGARSYAEYTGKENTKLIGVMNAAANTVEFGPMLCILFLSARMRALQHGTQPLPWAQNCMLASTGALGLTTIMAIVVPLVMGGEMKINPTTNEATFEVPNPTLGYAMIAIRCICQACFYGGAVGVAYSIVTFKAPVGPTVPVSPTVQCVLSLTLQYFFVYTILTVFTTMSEVSGGKLKLTENSLFAAVEASKATLQFAPMLSILFVTTRMYALLLTKNAGAPQAYVQDAMFMATWSLLISFLACLATGAVMDKVETDEDGNVVSKFSNQYAAMAMTGVRYLSMALLYGGIGIVIYGLFNMTPENANGRGSLPILSDQLRKTPFVKAPPTTDVASKAAKAIGF